MPRQCCQMTSESKGHFGSEPSIPILLKLVDDQACIVPTKVVNKHRYFEAHKALNVTLAVGSSNKPACDMVVISDFMNHRFTLIERVTANVAPSNIIIFFLLESTHSLNRSICPKNRYDFRFPHNKRVKELGERVLSDFYFGLIIKVI